MVKLNRNLRNSVLNFYPREFAHSASDNNAKTAAL